MIAVSFSVPFENPGLKEERSLRIWLLGVGGSAANPALAAYLSREQPRLLIVSGFAGALHPQIRIGETFLCKNMSDPDAIGTLMEKGWISPPSATLYTSKELIATACGKADLYQSTGSDLVDMETQSLFETARFHSIPVITIRAVSDTAATDFPVPEPILYDKHHQCPRPMALCAYLAMHPQRIPQFIRMLRQLSQARTQLGRHLRMLLKAAAR